MDTNEENSIHHSVYPWDHLELDANTQTGGDWYKVLLSASLGGKIVHGANTAPTCEVLTKVSEARAGSNYQGLITWDDTLMLDNKLGYDIADKMYSHHNYQGSVTLSGACLAYDIGLWEPAARKRARSSALLAAGMCVNGMSKDDALYVTGKIVGEKLDPESVESALLPASHLKREMTVVSKPNHRVFGRGSIQRGITWHDSSLSADNRFRNVAFDWGRVTAVARYIAEANIQTCPYFRQIAKEHGIPYMLVRNSWAYVSQTDYQFLPQRFAKIPAINCAHYGMPTVQGLFEGHEQDVMFALSRNAGKYAELTENDGFTGYFNLMKASRKRKHTRERLRVPAANQASVVEVPDSMITPEDAADLLRGSNAARHAFISALASRRARDSTFSAKLKAISTLDPTCDRHFEQIDTVTGFMYEQQNWLIAKSIAEESIVFQPTDGSPVRDRARAQLVSQLTRLKQDVFGYNSHLTSGTVMSNSAKAQNRRRTVSYAKESEDFTRAVTYTQRSLVGSNIRQAMTAVSEIQSKHYELLVKVNTEVAGIYEEWSDRFLKSDATELKDQGYKCAFLWLALQNLTHRLCNERNHGYIDGMVPRRSFVYQAVVHLSVACPHDKVKLNRPSYTDAMQIAQDIDARYELPYKVFKMVEYTLPVVDIVIGDLLNGKLWEPDISEFERLQMAFGCPRSPQYDTSMMQAAEEEAMAAQMMASLNKRSVLNFRNTYDACLNSYRNEAEGDGYARAAGYTSLRHAWQTLGSRAHYYEENPFIVEARLRLAEQAQESEDSASSSSGGFTAVI